MAIWRMVQSYKSHGRGDGGAGGGIFLASHSLRHCGEKWHILIDLWSVNLPHLTVQAYAILYSKWVLMNCSVMWDGAGGRSSFLHTQLIETAALVNDFITIGVKSFYMHCYVLIITFWRGNIYWILSILASPQPFSTFDHVRQAQGCWCQPRPQNRGHRLLPLHSLC